MSTGSAPTAEGSSLELTVLMPCLDEARTLPAVIEKAKRAIALLGVPAEILVADNGSTDGSPRIAREHGARVVAVAESGYGAAVRGGIAAARGTFIVMGDADDTYDFTQIGRFLERLRDGADLVMGTRLHSGRIEPGANPWLNRQVGTPLLTLVLNGLFGTGIHDCNCGMRGFSRRAALAMGLESDGMECATEMIVKAALCHFRIDEVPVTLYPDRRGRPPHLRRWRDGWRHLGFMLSMVPMSQAAGRRHLGWTDGE